MASSPVPPSAVQPVAARPSLPPHAFGLRVVALWGGRILLAVYFAAALLILAGRYLLMPEIAHHKDWVAARISAAIGLPVEIGALSAQWPGLHPQFEIRDMRILDAAGRSALSFDRVHATVGWSSLWHFGIHLHRLEVHAPALDIRREADGGLFVAGLAVSGEGDNAFLDWLLAQRRIIVRDARLAWHDALRGAPPLVLTALDFELRNFARQHSFGLRAMPLAEAAARIDLRGNFTGSAKQDWSTWDGALYADLERAELAAWSQWVDLPFAISAGRGDLRLWLDFADLSPTAFTADLRLADIHMRLREDLPVLDLERLAGRIEGRLKAGGQAGFSGALRRFALATRDGIVVPPTDVRLAVDLRKGKESGEFYADRLDLDTLARLAAHLPLPDGWRTRLQELSPRGHLADWDVSWRGPAAALERWRSKARFEQLGVAARRELPGFGGLSGSLEGDEKAGTIRLDSRDVHFELPAVFPTPTLPLDALQAELGWRARVGGGFELQLSRVVFRNADAHGEAAGSYRYTGQGAGEIDLSAKLAQAAGNAVWRYLPLVVSADARDWLRAGIVAGRAEGVQVRIKGPLDAFPFRGGKGGIFQVRGAIRDVTLHFAPGWPQMTGIDGELLFENERMTIRGRRATLMGLGLSDVRAEIPDLEAAEEVLLASGKARGRTQAFLDFIEASPVGAMIDRFTQPIRAQGEGELELKLTMPLRKVATTRVDGRYRFTGNDVQVLPQLPVFSAAQGEVAFTADRLEAKNLRARFLGAPVAVDVRSGAGGIVRVAASGRLSVQALRRQPGFEDMRFLDHLSGEAPWRASVTIKKPGAEALIESSLEGLSSSLPVPLNKSVRDALPLKVVGRLGDREDEWTAALGQVAQVRLVRTDGDWRGRLALGEAPRKLDTLPERGLALEVMQASVDLDAWRKLADANQASFAAASQRRFPELSAVKLRAAEVRLAGRRFHDVRVNAARSTNKVWRLGIESREAQGRLTWDETGAGHLIGRFARIDLPASEYAQPSGEPLRPDDGNLPAIDLRIDSLRLSDMDLGATNLQAEHRAGEWLAKLEIANETAKLIGDGRWRPGGDSVLEFALDVLDAEKLLVRLGLPDALRRGSGRIEGSLNWAGSPFAFDLASLGGRLKAEVERGQFKKLEPGVGRLLGVLSLQMLPRRLALDFRDVFSEGFAFDSIAGEASIARGIVSSRELQIRGPAARILLSGQADLVKETQNLRVRVQPSLGDTVSSGALLVNPVAGAALWLAQKAMGDPFGQMLAYEYAVTGSWHDPQVEKLTTASRPNENSPP